MGATMVYRQLYFGVIRSRLKEKIKSMFDSIPSRRRISSTPRFFARSVLQMIRGEKEYGRRENGF
jgi:hypothetical protein